MTIFIVFNRYNRDSFNKNEIIIALFAYAYIYICRYTGQSVAEFSRKFNVLDCPVYLHIQIKQ